MRVLVAYATRTGSTRGIAEEIGRALRERGVDVDVRDVREIREAGSLEGYGAVVLGSAIRVRRWLREAMAFLSNHRGELARLPVAYFTVSLTGVHGGESAKREQTVYCDYPKRHIEEVQPVAEGCFNGALDLAPLPAPERAFVRAFGVDEGDYRDWDAIRAWALEAGERVGALVPAHA